MKLLFSALIAMTLLSSFNHRRDPNSATSSAAGIYGVCCDALSFKFELELNADHTFHYVNTSVPGKPIDTKGTWEQNGSTVTLSNYTSDFAINEKWKIDSNNGIKSRKGLLFTRLEKCP